MRPESAIAYAVASAMTRRDHDRRRNTTAFLNPVRNPMAQTREIPIHKQLNRKEIPPPAGKRARPAACLVDRQADLRVCFQRKCVF
jgi:hypothetical protein